MGPERPNLKMAWEPNLNCAGALYSPTSGLIEPHDLMTAYLGDAENCGAVLAVNTKVLSGEIFENFVELVVSGNPEFKIRCGLCVNAAGHGAQKIAAAIKGISSVTVPKQFLTRGCYFVMHGRKPFNRMIYPLPKDHAISVHGPSHVARFVLAPA